MESKLSKYVLNLVQKPEKLDRKISTYIVIGILDDILYNCVNSAFCNTRLFKRLLIQSAIQYFSDKRRKMSFLSLEEQNAWIFKACVFNNAEYLRMAHLDRSILFILVNEVYKKLKLIYNVETQLIYKTGNTEKLLLKKKTLCNRFGVQENIAYPLYQHLKTMIKLYDTYKLQVMSKYLKLAYYETLSAGHATRMTTDYNDLYSNLVVGINKAIDKCDPTKGTLTSYVQQWFVAAKNNPESGHQYNIAYVLPPAVRRANEIKGIAPTDFTGTMPDANVLIDDKEQGLEQRFRSLEVDKFVIGKLRYARKAKVSFLALDLPIVLTDKEKKILKKQSIQECNARNLSLQLG